MKRKALWIATATAALALGTFSTQASAHGDPVAGAIVGGAIGAAVGGPVGAAVGAIFGTAIASTPHHPALRPPQRRGQPRRGRAHSHLTIAPAPISCLAITSGRRLPSSQPSDWVRSALLRPIPCRFA